MTHDPHQSQAPSAQPTPSGLAGTEGLIDPQDSLQRQNQKLLKIVATLMRRVEQDTDASGVAYAQFERAAMLEAEVRSRTRDLQHTLELLNRSNSKLAQANRETEAARANLTNAIETIQEGFALFDPQDRLVMYNSRFGMHMADLRPQLTSGLRFETYVHLASQSPDLALAKGVSAQDWARRRLDRHTQTSVMFNVEMTGNRWVQVSEHRTGDGGTVILQTDISDIMRLQHQERERLLDDQARLIQATLEHLNQGVGIFDGAGQLVGWNQLLADLLAIPATKLQLGLPFAMILEWLRSDFTFDGAVSADDVARWSRRDADRVPLAFDLHHSDHRILTVFMQQMPDDGFVISFTDVTRERQAVRAMRAAKETLEDRVAARTLELQDALRVAERANASKSRFVAAASHDLLQPLSAAKLFVAALDSELSGDGARDTLAKAASALDSVEDLLTALLDISRFDSGRASTQTGAVHLDVLLTQLGDELRPSAQTKGIDLRLRPTRVQVLSDATYLRRIVQNLMTNAIRYTHTGGVLVGVRRRGACVRLEIWDTGVGIAATDQTRIFAEFQRINATASAADGMGLGLAIVERACALLDHPLSLRSVPGKGTVFAIELPCVETHTDISRGSGRGSGRDSGENSKRISGTDTGDATPVHADTDMTDTDAYIGRDANQPSDAPRTDTATNTLIVLLIEHDPDLRQALTLTLEQWGMEVLTCASEQDAIDLIAEIGILPDVLIADMQLPQGCSGGDAIANLCQRFAPLPACLISADHSAAARNIASELGVPLFHKPIDPRALLAFLKAQRPRTN
ncbi:PAS-domain containing protein [Phaeobacter sp.]|uniref:hybrid sensor histidine kinase/response regulator n=1 Tax=Phaeobacter sp. TaxID=1902409 RepID=UPI0025EB7E07|nr:PAS-domain containing protein [Phaeobacter sp.]